MKTSSDLYVNRFLSRYKNQFGTVYRSNDILSISYLQTDQSNNLVGRTVPSIEEAAVKRYIKDLANFITHDTNVNYITIYRNDANPLSTIIPTEALKEWEIITKALFYNKTIISFQYAFNIEDNNSILASYIDKIKSNKDAIYRLIAFIKQPSYKLRDNCEPIERAKHSQQFKLYQLMKDYFIAVRNVNKQTFNGFALELDADLQSLISGLTNEHFKRMDFYIRQHYWEITGVVKNMQSLEMTDLETLSRLKKMYFIYELEAICSDNFPSVNKSLFSINTNVRNSEIRDFNGRTKLIIESYLLNPSAVKELLSRGANVNAIDDEGYNALHRTIEINRRCHIQDNIQTNQKEIIKLLVLANIDTNAQTNDLKLTALHFAAKFGNIEVLKLLIDAGVDLYIKNYGNRTPLETAIRANKVNAQAILQNADDRARLIKSSYLLDLTTVKELLDKDVYVNAVDNEGYNALHKAIENSHLSRPSASNLALTKNIIKLLIAAKIDVDAQTTKLKLTALHFAAKFDNIEAIELLVNAGANLSIRNYDYRTPLETAIRAENIDAQELLQDAAKVNEAILSEAWHTIYNMDY